MNAIENMTIATKVSKIFQKMGLDMSADAACAPKPMEENQRRLAAEAPIAKNQRSDVN